MRNATPERLQQIEDARSAMKHVSIEARGGTWNIKEMEGPDAAECFYEVDDGPGAR